MNYKKGTTSKKHPGILPQTRRKGYFVNKLTIQKGLGIRYNRFFASKRSRAFLKKERSYIHLYTSYHTGLQKRNWDPASEISASAATYALTFCVDGPVKSEIE